MIKLTENNINLIEGLIGDWLNTQLDSIDGEDPIVDLYLYLHSSKIIVHEEFGIHCITEDGEVSEVNFHDLVESVKYFIFEGYLDDLEIIYKYLVDLGEIKK